MHFRSKRQVLLVLMDRWLHEIALVESADAAVPAASPREAVAALVRNALRIDAAFLGAYRAWHELVLHDAELAARHARIDAWTRERVVAMLSGLAEHPGARPGLDVPSVAIVLNALFWRILEMGVAADENVVRTTVDLVTRTLLRDEAT